MYDIEADLKRQHDLSITCEEKELYWSPAISKWKVVRMSETGQPRRTMYRGDSLQTAMSWLIWGHEGTGQEG